MVRQEQKEEVFIYFGLLRLHSFMGSVGFPIVTCYSAVRIIMDLRTDIQDKDVLIVEDIVDSGHTLQYLQVFKPLTP